MGLHEDKRGNLYLEPEKVGKVVNKYFTDINPGKGP